MAIAAVERCRGGSLAEAAESEVHAAGASRPADALVVTASVPLAGLRAGDSGPDAGSI